MEAREPKSKEQIFAGLYLGCTIDVNLGIRGVCLCVSWTLQTILAFRFFTIIPTTLLISTTFVWTGGNLILNDTA